MRVPLVFYLWSGTFVLPTGRPNLLPICQPVANQEPWLFWKTNDRYFLCGIVGDEILPTTKRGGSISSPNKFHKLTGEHLRHLRNLKTHWEISKIAIGGSSSSSSSRSSSSSSSSVVEVEVSVVVVVVVEV